MDIRSVYLIVIAVALFPIALSYGAAPHVSLSFLFGIEGITLNEVHIFRAVMGLYLATLIFWICGAFIASIRTAALWSLVVFMLGLAAGRLFSLMMDGGPSQLLIIYLVLEIICAVLGLALLAKKAP
ncbi:DUF4345 domain-containing protein [Flexibacterium corallicola]|uniref:DUF4345 domain-containing protein n=1 Tax=Flexibacterium corallicola TaxID=3037259 RepID=UPI00286F1D24|nr:DUF4345 domain-containing protein [Pseudovibrio sp. M1P-2-3]